MAGKKKDNAAVPQKWEDVPEIPKEEQPYPLPEEWKWVKLHNVAELIMGQSPCGEDTTEDSKFTPLIGGASDMGLLYPEIKKYTKKSTKLSQLDDIIVCVRATLGKPIFSDGVYCLGRGVAAIRPHIIDKKFLRYFLINFEQYLYDNATGSTFAQINSEKLADMPIPFPLLETQQRIVNRIESLFFKLDEAAEKVQAVIDSHEARKQAILHKAFSGELTKKWREENRVSLDSWEEKNLIDICTIKSGTTIDKSEELESGEIPYIKVADMNLPENNFEILTSSRFVNQINKNNLFPKNCIIFPKRGGAIFTNKKRIVRESEILADLNIMAIIPNEKKIALMFLYYWFLTIDLSTLNNGTNVPQINNKDFIPIKIKLPSINEQSIIIKLIKKFLTNDTQINNNIREVNNIIFSIKKSTLTLSFAGEL